nr:variable surface lipoprotein [Mycoplasmopsis bovis]
MSSMPLIAASCENKNPTDESIINNIAPPTQSN